MASTETGTHGGALSEDIKVTDKRMFTPEGELREEYRHLEAERKQGPASAPSASSPPPAPSPPAAETSPTSAPAAPGPPSEEPARAPLELPATPPEMGGPSFYDLVGLIAEPVAIYLGDVRLPDGQTAENLEVARFHIDLLDVLRQKTAGNLDAQEMSVLEDVLYRLRVRYVQKRG
jgi:hypothetical protein